ncbi:MAG: hypothetical protein V4591_01120 [Bdellovibrionota bacterium]
MKKKYLWFVLFFNIPANIFAADVDSSSASAPATQQNTMVLPPIRRVGLDLVESNVDEFRSFMRKQDLLLHGAVALPYNEQDMKKMFASDLEKQAKGTGRFWDLSLTQFLTILPTKNQAQKEDFNKVTTLKNKLELDYNLDAWIKPTVIFSPDETLVRLTLNGSGNAKSNWAREDILLEAQASEDKITAAFLEALSRLISTIGHDGRIAYTRDNLMTLDFGTERGLERGQKINAGYVILTSYNPQSGEFLRAQRVPLYELKVLEARKGSTLCQITSVDKIKQEQITKTFDPSTIVMLAWRAEKDENKIGWKEPYDPQTAPILGSAESGFGVPIEKNPPPEPPVAMAAAVETNKKVSMNNAAQQQGNMMPEAGGATTSLQETSNSINKYPIKRKAMWNAPESWTFTELKAGGGVSLGSFAEGESSSFPHIIINRLDAKAMALVDSNYDLYAKPFAQYAFYSGNISGNSYLLGSAIYNAAWSSNVQAAKLFLGSDIEITGGNIQGTKTNSSLSNIQIDPSVRWQANLSGLGKYSLEGSFSLFDIVQNYPAWTLQFEVQPMDLMPKQVSFDIGMRRYKLDWIEFTLGVSWDFNQGN